MNNKSPLRYPGGKTRACKIIEQELLKRTDITKYSRIVSPFFGGGSFEFYMQNKYDLQILANDKFLPLYQFWHHAKIANARLCELINSFKTTTKDQFAKYREKIMTLTDGLQQAALYFVINRCSFSGATLSGGFSQQAAEKRFTDSSIKRVQNLDLSNTVFSNHDFTYFLENNTHQDAIIFLDPPYYLEKGSKLYGRNGDLHETFDHGTLANALKEKKNWILCYNNCTYIRDLYKEYTIVDVNWSYGMNKTKKSSEILIICF